MRLIDADAIQYCEYDLDNYHWFRAVDEDEIAEMPTIDAVPVVRCKDCQKFDPDEIIAPETGTCWQYEVVKDFNGFCDYGK